VGSGVNDSRRKLLAILADPTITVIAVEHKDRLTRFGFRYIETLLAVQGRRIEVVNAETNPIEDLMADEVEHHLQQMSPTLWATSSEKENREDRQGIGKSENSIER
jgi:predicted site-specific integrase-resolvase